MSCQRLRVLAINGHPRRVRLVPPSDTEVNGDCQGEYELGVVMRLRASQYKVDNKIWGVDCRTSTKG